MQWLKTYSVTFTCNVLCKIVRLILQTACTSPIPSLFFFLPSIASENIPCMLWKKKKKTIKIGLVSRKRLYGILENNNHSLIVSTLKFL